MITFCNSLGAHWAAWVVPASLSAGLVFAIVGLAWLPLRNRVAPQVGYWLFLLVPLKLLLPVAVTVPASVAQWSPAVLLTSLLESTPTRSAEVALHQQPVTVASVNHGERLTSVSAPLVSAELEDVPARGPRTGGELVPSATVSPVSVVSRAPRLTIEAALALAWFAGVVLLLGRFVRAQWTFRRRLSGARPVDSSSLGVDLRDLCRRAGVPESTPIVQSGEIAVPAVWGFVRPTIIVPAGIAAALTPAQLRWVLLHELAHIRRRDLIVVTLQRLAAVLHFFNPIIWIANRVIHQLREYACDDIAVAQSQSTAFEPGEAFVRVLRHAQAGRGKLQGALGVLELDARAWCFRRVRRLLEIDRPIRTRLGAGPVCALVLAAVVALPYLRAASSEPGKKSEQPGSQPNGSKPSETKTPTKVGREFELRVVGPDGKPVPNAVVNVRAGATIAAKSLRMGKLIKQSDYGTDAVTDAGGQLVFELPPERSYLSINITTPGYGPYWAEWSSEARNELIPDRLTAELDAGWSVGGIIVDEHGKPVEGVTIAPFIEFKKRPGLFKQLASGARVKTDAGGKWRFDSVPDSKGEVAVEINHPAFLPVRRSLGRGGFGVRSGGEPTAKITLERGLALTGKVTDESGKPIAGARVYTKFVNNLREAKTAADGSYTLIGCERGPARLVVAAPGHATDMKDVTLEPPLKPVDFTMKPSPGVRIRVVDQQGKPAPRTRIFFQRWRGTMFSYFEFDGVNQYADQNGVWIWNEAPLDEFKADICPPGGMQLLEEPITARAEEYVYRVYGPLVISGAVIDAETKEPIKKFRVVPGVRAQSTEIFWSQSEAFTAANGRYEISQSRGYPAHRVRIEANGYRAAESRDIKSDEGKVTFDFALQRGQNVAAKVVTPRNVAAVGAKVALGIKGSQISIKNGDIDDGSTYAAREITDQAGRFYFAAQTTDFHLVITHPSGFAHIKSGPDWELTRIIRLEPWSKVEGTFRVGKEPVADVSLRLSTNRPVPAGISAPNIFSIYETTTGPDGHYAFDQVIPGAGSVGRNITLLVDRGATEVTSSGMVPTKFPAGKTVHLDLGGTGRAVIGRLQAPKGIDGEVQWSFALVTLAPAVDNPGKQGSAVYFTATVDRDGRFRVDDVPVGQYALNVYFQPPRQNIVGVRRHAFAVPAAPGDAAGPAVDLGTLTLEGPAGRAR
jgi:beta-lactamase regulating signal transducer with metallopeptidase domain/uncharacterized GH25 family protein